MAISKITASGVATDTLTAADIAANAIGSSEIADDAVGTDQLSNAVAISTSGAITTTGAFTSVGIDDNASGAVAITIDSDEKVGIGETSPDNKLHVKYGDVGVASNTNCGLTVEGSPNEATEESGINILSTAGGNIFFGDAASAVVGRIKYDHADNKMQLHTAGTERMRITTDGNVGIGETPSADERLIVKGIDTSGSSEMILSLESNSTSLFTVNREGSFGFKGEAQLSVTAGSDPHISFSKTSGTTSNGTVWAKAPAGDYFGIGAGGNAEGMAFQTYDGGWQHRMTIGRSGNIGAPTGTNIYNASDERLKENISTLTGCLSTINKLRGVSFNWIDGFDETEKDKTLYGFIAQEVESEDSNLIEPFGAPQKAGEPVVGEDGKLTDELTVAAPHTITVKGVDIESPLRVNEKFIIPLLVEAVKELSAKVTALEAA